jgi:hypothetical protein
MTLLLLHGWGEAAPVVPDAAGDAYLEEISLYAAQLDETALYAHENAETNIYGSQLDETR